MPLPGLRRVLLCGPLLTDLKRLHWRHSPQSRLPTWKDDKEGFHFPEHDRTNATRTFE